MLFRITSKDINLGEDKTCSEYKKHHQEPTRNTTEAPIKTEII